MALARKNIVDTTTPGFYHCTYRCVRRARLCGKDKLSGRNYEHRKNWIEKRLLELCSIFSIEVYAYAVMSNHYHIVLYLDPLAPQKWSDEEVAERWLKVYPSKLNLTKNQSLRQIKKQALMSNPKKLKVYRQRLGSLSWYMRRLNEPLAKLSNQEDNCTGRFWEDRFKSQALLDEGAILSCMAYVDLNPVRGHIAQNIEESSHTSIKARVTEVQQVGRLIQLKAPLAPITKKYSSKRLNIKLQEYIELVEWAGVSIIYPDKARLPKRLKPILRRLNLQSTHWLKQIENLESHYSRVIGPIDKIKKKARQVGVHWLHGVSSARQLFIHSG